MDTNILSRVTSYESSWSATLWGKWNIVTDFEPNSYTLRPFITELQAQGERIEGLITKDKAAGKDVTNEAPEFLILQGEVRVFRTTHGV